MLSGKWISNMFEPSKNFIIDNERFNYEFICELDSIKLGKFLENSFSKCSKQVLFTEMENGKFSVEMKFSSIESILLILHIFKIKDDKLVFSICYKSVISINK